jgi:hypothetical protein
MVASRVPGGMGLDENRYDIVSGRSRARSARADPRDVRGFHAVMAAVEEVTQVVVRER